MYVSAQYKTQKMCDKAVGNYSDTLTFVPISIRLLIINLLQYNLFLIVIRPTKSVTELLILVPDLYKTNKICNKPVNTNISAVKFVSGWYKTHKSCNKAVDTYPSAVKFASNCYKTEEMCDKVTFKEAFMLKYCLDRYDTQGMCDNVVDDCLLALKFVPNLCVTSKMHEQLDNATFSNDDIVFINEDDMGLNTKYLNNINLDDDDFDDDDGAETIIHIRLMAWCNRYKQCRVCKQI